MANLPSTFSGCPSEKAICRDSLIEETIKFIGQALLRWRNDDALKNKTTLSEKKLNGNLSDFLSISHHMIYFRHEQDEHGLRSVDIAAKPRQLVIISGRNYNYSQPILLIEAKRLPAPTKDRKREYVTGENGEITGGIQRFKLGEHGRDHKIAVIVGYVQKQTSEHWYLVINSWIKQLAEVQADLWNQNEKLSEQRFSDCRQLAHSTSFHSRHEGDCPFSPIQLHHFWIQLN